MNILVINCGSSSLKFQLINSESEQCIAKGLCERIGIDGSKIVYTPAGGEKEATVTPMADHTDAIRLVLEALTNEKTGVVKSLDEIGAIGHRMVHGGEKFSGSVVITDEVIAAVKSVSEIEEVICSEYTEPDTSSEAVEESTVKESHPQPAKVAAVPAAPATICSFQGQTFIKEPIMNPESNAIVAIQNFLSNQLKRCEKLKIPTMAPAPKTDKTGMFNSVTADITK